MIQKPKALFLSHGGGPMPLLGDDGHLEMVACLQNIASNMATPEAIVVVSAHWEETISTITAGSTPSLIYDYYQFPPAAYTIQYPCSGSPDLANEVHHLLRAANIPSQLDKERGFDHGLFVPLKLMYPAANIPCVQLSLVNTLDPRKHIEIGTALQSLSQKNVLVIGSGLSFHNLHAFFSEDTRGGQNMNHAFEEWLLNTCSDADNSEEDRVKKLVHWGTADGAGYCHPREEHLLPLHVCYGVAQAPCSECFELEIMRKKVSMYLW